VITQCSIRHLYNATPKNDALIGQAKALERRRCNHHLLDEPLSTLECLSSVVDPKDQNVNKYNYVVASQDDEVRANMRRIPGVPLIYIKRSIMILEPMAGASEDQRSREERGKFKLGISRTGGRGSTLGKRRREEEEADGVGNENSIGVTGGTNGQDESARKKKKRGPKGPNPLSVKKPKVRAQMEPSSTAKTQPVNETNGDVVKKKRKRKHKDKEGSGTDGIAATTGGDVSDG
jgi:U3 small nucleolar RNA-associated protein 23